MVEYLSATRFHPAFGDAVLPGSLHARLLWLQTPGFQEGDDFRVDLRVAVQDDVTIRTSFGEGLTQLLDDPLCSRCRVTLKCKILQRPCSITKKQYSSLNVTVGTVKKSKAAITSR